MKRLIIVYNPHSTNFKRVQAEVLDKANTMSGHMIGKFAIRKAPFEENVKLLTKILRDDDLVVAAGGDATASVTFNAIMRSGKDATLAVLPYGNFNDLARTLGMLSFDDIFSSKVRTEKFYPLEPIIDGKLWRYAACYVTMGMTAEAVVIFDEPKIRKNMQKGHKSSWRSYLQLMSWYFKNRHKKTFIPEFKLNGKLQHKKTSDYAAVNGRSMCRVMKGGEDYKKPKVFRSLADRLTSFWRISKLMIVAIIKRTPGNDTNGDTLEFTNPATISLQAEGEYQTFEKVNKIEVRKSEKCLKVIQG